jgi:ATPase family associated with various cellular activities (AAA)
MNFRTIVAGYIMMYMGNPAMIALFLLKMIGKNVYTVYFDDRAHISRFEKRVKDAATYTFLSWKNISGREYPQGFYVGRNFLVYFQGSNTGEVSATVVGNPDFYATLMSPPEPMKIVAKTETITYIDVYVQKGSFKNIYYTKLKLQLDHLTPLPPQKVVVEGILDVYHQHGRATVFLHGVTGAGKSSVGYLVAKALHGKYCHSFNPSEPGNQISSLLCDADIDASSPLVIVLEEVDELILRLNKGDVKVNHDVPTAVFNKSTWASFLDDMFLYKNVVLIMTSNTPKSVLDDVDPSYLRHGRVHASYCMNEPLEL